jgi:hypothetical protein
MINNKIYLIKFSYIKIYYKKIIIILLNSDYLTTIIHLYKFIKSNINSKHTDKAITNTS